LISHKGVQRFNDDAGDGRLILFGIGFNSFREQTRYLNVELFGYIIALVFETIAVHGVSF